MLGATTVAVSPAVPQGSILFGLGLPVVALGLHAAVQQVVFFRVILKNAAEGVHSRGVTPGKAAVGAVAGAILLFIVMHGEMTAFRALDLVIAGGIFGLLYLHTGEIALGIGTHFGALYAGTLVFGVVRVTGTLSGVLGVLDQYGFPKMVVAYILVLGSLVARSGEVPIEPGIATWSD